MRLLHIAEGWSKSLGLWEVTNEEAAMSAERMKICAGCDLAKESKFLAFLKGGAFDMQGMYCSSCGCPVNEKSLVVDEQCPVGKW